MEKAKDSLKSLYKWGRWESNSFTLCGVRYQQKLDYSVKMDQQDFTRKLYNAEFNLPKNLNRINGKQSWTQMG